MIKTNQPAKNNSEVFQPTANIANFVKEDGSKTLKQLYQGTQGRQEWREVTSIPEIEVVEAPVVKDAPVAEEEVVETPVVDNPTEGE